VAAGQAYQRGRHVGLPSVLARHRRHEVVSTIHSRVSAAMTVKHLDINAVRLCFPAAFRASVAHLHCPPSDNAHGSRSLGSQSTFTHRVESTRRVKALPRCKVVHSQVGVLQMRS
jgi:hypothetical protein